MKVLVKVMAVVFVAVLMLAAKCENKEISEIIEASESEGGNASDLLLGDWLLREVLSDFKMGGRALPIDRDELESKGLGNAFTLTITAERLGGKAAPNTYGAPYTTGEKNAITIQPMVSTMMAPLFELDTLKEQDYYQYLQSAYKWSVAKGQLLMFGKNSQGAEVVLVFTQKN